MLRISPEEIDEAGIRAFACDCGTRRDRWRTSRKCFRRWVCLCLAEMKGACLSHDVKQREIIEVETLRHQQRILPRNNGETHLHPAEDCQKHEPSDENMGGTQDASHIGQLGCANRICGESGSLQKNTHTAPQCSTIQIKV